MKSCLAAFALSINATNASPTSGHAKAEWIAETAALKPGAIRTVVKLTIDKGWHTYWINPGEGGMPLSVTWDFPEGWSAGEIQHPAPIRFMTGDLPGLGYEGVVLLPVNLTPPPAMPGPATLAGKLSWLTCNESSCVPGSAEISLRIETGAPAAVENPQQSELIEKAYSAIPQPLPASELEVKLEKEDVALILTLPEGSEIDPARFNIFPATRNVIDPAARPVFAKVPDSPNKWRASGHISEYLNEKPDSVTLVLADDKGARFVVSTKGE